MKIGCVLAFGLLMTSACTEGPKYPLPSGTDTYFDGYINKGEKLGVKIGDDRMDVRKRLSGRYEYYQAFEDDLGNIRADHDTCDEQWRKYYVLCQPGEMFDYYRIRDFGRNGRMLVFFDKNQKVTAIHWDTSFWGTIDL